MEKLSADGWKEGMESAFWKELESRLKQWIPDLQHMLEDPDSDYPEREYQQARGSLRAIRHLLDEPAIALEEKETAEKQAKGENDG